MSCEWGPQNGAVRLHDTGRSGAAVLSQTADVGGTAAGCGLRWPD
jgi:hypothetical protein